MTNLKARTVEPRHFLVNGKIVTQPVSIIGILVMPLLLSNNHLSLSYSQAFLERSTPLDATLRSLETSLASFAVLSSNSVNYLSGLAIRTFLFFSSE